jgi:nitrate/TMAO reductase-like tetraheme cytochrome c subunit
MKLPRLAYNFLSSVGIAIAILSALTMVVLFSVSLLSEATNPYLGIVLYLVGPAVLFLGLVLIPAGMIWQARRERRLGVEAAALWPRLDLNVARQRRATMVFLLGLVGFLLVSAVGSYQAYHFTESNQFCGQTCHGVMHPEFIAYQNSSHARVKCVDCHIGSGAGWYAKSKLSGAYQVYATLTDKYPRPIPTPIANLRPAQETCEQCHWPERFFGAQQRQFNHYMYDSANTHWPINMLVKTGGGDPKTGQTSGIHWHMNIAVKVEYIARGERRQEIPWIRVTDQVTGRVTEYMNSDDPLSDEELATASRRRMDCMDCHNRPSHNYYSPDHQIDVAILTGRIEATLPHIKRVAVEAMAAEYESAEAAREGIADAITRYYREKWPGVYSARRVDVDQAILAAQEAYSRSIFPVMKVNWSAYPDDIGHFIYPGCMRCHDGKHKSEDGLTLTADCRTCHVILSQGSGERAQVATSEEGLEFEHPEDIGEAWRETGCFECHTGVQP